MNSSSSQKSCRRYSGLIVPVLIYLISFVGPAIVMVIPTALLGWSKDYWFSHLHITGTLGQALMDLPAVIMFARIRRHGTGRGRVRVISAGVGLGCAVILAGIRVALTARLMGGTFMGGVPAFTQSLTLAWPWNVLSASAALLAYGPGEAIFVIYLITSFDAALGSQHRVFSWGVVITSLLWALPHIANVFYFGWEALSNVLIMAFIGLAMGLLLKGTRSSLGPVVFWTLVNGTSA